MAGGSLYADCAARVRDVVAGALEGHDPAPDVTVGGRADPGPFDALVRELPESVELSDLTSSRATLGGARVSGCCELRFTVRVEMVATRPTVEDAAATCMSWVEASFGALLADRTLGGLVEHAVPEFQAGYSAVSGRQFKAGVVWGVRCKATLYPSE